jgi:hypothetical protein
MAQLVLLIPTGVVDLLATQRLASVFIQQVTNSLALEIAHDTFTVLSTAEAEDNSASTASSEVLYLRNKQKRMVLHDKIRPLRARTTLRALNGGATVLEHGCAPSTLTSGTLHMK